MDRKTRVLSAFPDVLFTPLLEAALRLAARGHYHQFRKQRPDDAGCRRSGGDDPLPSGCIPYITHPVGTMCILARLGASDEVLAAALLHDYLEDVPDRSGRETIRQHAGPEVLRLVEAVTENKRPEQAGTATWELRKQEQVERIAEMPEEAVLIKAADTLHNILSLTDDLRHNNDSALVWHRFNAAPQRKLWYFEEIHAASRQRLGDHPLIEQLGSAITTLNAFLPADQEDRGDP